MSGPSAINVTPAPPSDNSWKVLAGGTAVALLLISLALVALYGQRPWYQAVLIIVFVSYFPLSYLSYLQFRAESHKERVKDDFRLLGLVQGASGAAELDLLYHRIYSWQQFVIYVPLATLTTLLGFGLFHFRAILTFVPEMVAVTMFHSFLGAYVFSIYYVYRRYSTLDLQPCFLIHVQGRK